MRIAIDVTGWQDTRGFGRFTRELVSQLVLDNAAIHDVVLIADRATASQATFPTGARVVVVNTGVLSAQANAAESSRSPIALLALGWHAARCRPDVVFFPTPSTYYPVLGRVPIVVGVHDVMTEEHPERFFFTPRARFYWRAKMWLMRKQAMALVAPSEDARQRVAAAFSWSLAHITCIHEAPAAIFGSELARSDIAIDATLAQIALPRGVPLVLYVGALDPHKNLSNLLRAMAMIHPARTDAWHLVIVGAYHTGRAAEHAQHLLALRDALGLQTRVTLTGFVSDEHLVHLYQAAHMLVLPSLDEGFGLPVVEAMACGLPVAVSARGPLPALAGNAGLTFDPDDPASIAQTIAILLDDPDSKRSYGERGIERAREFTWQRTAARLTDVLRSVARVS